MYYLVVQCMALMMFVEKAVTKQRLDKVAAVTSSVKCKVVSH